MKNTNITINKVVGINYNLPWEKLSNLIAGLTFGRLIELDSIDILMKSCGPPSAKDNNGANFLLACINYDKLY